MSRRWPTILGGVFLSLAGAVVVIFSFAGIALASCDALVSEGSFRLRSPGVAVTVSSGVLELESASGGFLCEADYDRLTVRITARPAGGKQVFVGVAPMAAGERYLRAARYDRARELDLLVSEVRYRRAGGIATRLDRPERKTFWRAQERSTPDGEARLTYAWRASYADTAPESFRLVLMNADGSRRVTADAVVEVEVAGPTTWPYTVAILVGIAVIVAGIAVARRRPRSHDSVVP